METEEDYEVEALIEEDPFSEAPQYPLLPGPSLQHQEPYYAPPYMLDEHSGLLHPVQSEYPVIHLEESDDLGTLIPDYVIQEPVLNTNHFDIASNLPINFKFVAKKSTSVRQRVLPNYLQRSNIGFNPKDNKLNSENPLCTIVSVKSVSDQNVHAQESPIIENQDTTLRVVPAHKEDGIHSEWNQSENAPYRSLESGIEGISIKQETEELNIYDIDENLLENYQVSQSERNMIFNGAAELLYPSGNDTSYMKVFTSKSYSDNVNKKPLKVTSKRNKSNKELAPQTSLENTSVYTRKLVSTTAQNLEQPATSSLQGLSTSAPFHEKFFSDSEDNTSITLPRKARKRKLNAVKRYSYKETRKKEVLKKASTIPNLNPYTLLDHFTVADINALGGEAPRCSGDEKFGFARGLTPEKVIGSFKSSNGGAVYIIKWYGSDELDLVMAKEANQLCPQLVINYYNKLNPVTKG